MGDPAKPSDELLDISYDTLILALDIVKREALDPDRLANRVLMALQGQNFKKDIEDFLTDFSRSTLQQNSTSKVLNSSTVEKLVVASAEKEGKKIAQDVGKDILKQIENTQQVQDLKENLKKLGKEFTEQPIGVWLTDTKVYIIAAGVLVSGAAIVYVTSFAAKKVGVPTFLTALEGQMVKFKAFGKIDVSAGLAKVDKTAGVVDYKLTGTRKWEYLTVSLDGMAHASMKERAKVEGVGAKATITIPVEKNVKLNLTGGLDKPQINERSILYDIHAQLEITPENKGNENLGIKLKVDAYVKGDGAGGKRPEAGIGLNLEIPWGGASKDRSSLYDLPK